jgi:hypothetical protein
VDTAEHYRRIARLLSLSAKHKVQQAIPRFLQQSRMFYHPHNLSQAAINAIRPSFPSASPRELDVLAFYLVAKVASMAPGCPRKKVA